MNEQQLENKGVEIAHLCKWAGEDIVKIFQYALTDANFHTLNDDITEVWNKEQARN